MRMIDDLTPPMNMTMGEALDAAAERWPTRIGWVFESTRVTFSEMRRDADRLCSGLRSRGFTKGDVLAVWLPNVAEWAHALFASAKLGAQIVPLSTRWSASEARQVLERSNVKGLIFRPRVQRTDFSAMLEEIYPQLACALPRPQTGPAASAAYYLSLTPGDLNVRPLASLQSTGQRDLADAADVSPTEPLLIQYTSEHVEKPLDAILSQLHVLNFGVEVAMRLGVRAGESMLNTQPLYQAEGSCGAVPVPLALGCTVVMPEYYTPERSLHLLEREQCVARTGMSTMYLREMQLPTFADYDTSSLRSGWTIAPPRLMDRIRREFPIEGLVQLYGSSECGMAVGEPLDDWSVRRVSVGRPVSGVDLAIVGRDGTRLAAGEMGEICVRGWSRPLRYADDEATRRAVDADGWFHSKATGWLDEHGRLHYNGRLDELITSAGQTVSAVALEAVICAHPAVRQAAVIGVPDPQLGEAVLAVVELRSSSEVSADALHEFCTSRLAPSCVPRHWRFVTELPHTDRGDIAKYALQQRFGSNRPAAAVDASC